jgi:hypothetical protein
MPTEAAGLLIGVGEFGFLVVSSKGLSSSLCILSSPFINLVFSVAVLSLPYGYTMIYTTIKSQISPSDFKQHQSAKGNEMDLGCGQKSLCNSLCNSIAGCRNGRQS